MYQDSDSVDSDEGVRFKTESVRNKKSPESDRTETIRRRRSRSRSHSKDKKYTSRYSGHDRSRRMRRKSSHSSSNEDGYKEKKRSKRDKRKEQKSLSGKPKSDKKDDRPHKEKIVKEKCVPSKVDISAENHSLLSNLIKSKGREDNKLTADAKEMCSSFGPALPFHLLKEDNSVEDIKGLKDAGPTLSSDMATIKSSQNSDIESINIGPALPPHMKSNKSELSSCMGPNLPPTLLSDKNISKPDQTLSSVGPSLPPHMLDFKKCATTTGPSIPIEKENPLGPPALDDVHSVGLKMAEDPPEQTKLENRAIGPALPPHLRQLLAESSVQIEKSSEDEVEEEEAFGPLPVGQTKLTNAHLALEERALQMRLDQLNPKKDEPTRETWMLELPEATKKFGLGPRQFRPKAGPDLSDRSVWTDTPKDKAKKRAEKAEEKVDLKKESELKEIRRRDKEQEAIAKKHKKNKESLVDSHQKNLKKEKSGGPTERKPFNRETDLQVNKFDEAQKKAILKKAQLLDDRFSSGHSKFL